ncbi:MAG TPA: energy transducer TonB [Rhodanobacteraceae bacterium]|nr:energy transducer TonB [Rhodanobacteraceae bacterium]
MAAPDLRAVPPDQIDHYWLRTNTELDVDVPNFGKNLDKPTCSAVTYIIGSDGVTRDITVQRTVPAGDLALVAKSAVADLHYSPASGNDAREPVFTYIVMPFNLPADPAARAKITAACKLADFPKGYQ